MENKEIYELIDENIDWQIFEGYSEYDYIKEVEEEKKEPFRINDDNLASWALRKLAEIDSELEKKKAQVEYEISRLQHWLDTERVKSERSKSFFENRLEDYLSRLCVTDPKAKIKTPYGEVKYVKQQDEWKYDEEEVLRFLEEEKMENFLNIKKSINKKELKKLQVADGDVVTENGEIIPGIIVTKRPDALRIKLEE